MQQFTVSERYSSTEHLSTPRVAELHVSSLALFSWPGHVHLVFRRIPTEVAVVQSLKHPQQCVCSSVLCRNACRDPKAEGAPNLPAAQSRCRVESCIRSPAVIGKLMLCKEYFRRKLLSPKFGREGGRCDLFIPHHIGLHVFCNWLKSQHWARSVLHGLANCCCFCWKSTCATTACWHLLCVPKAPRAALGHDGGLGGSTGCNFTSKESYGCLPWKSCSGMCTQDS
eukprot:6480243-Amphidinium_carterae.1